MTALPFGLAERLLIDGREYRFDPYLNAWVGPYGVELTGWTIMHGMSFNTRVEPIR